MKLSTIINKKDALRPNDFWLWHPLLLKCLPTVKANGLDCPFLFGKRKSAAALRIIKSNNRVLLRIGRPSLEEKRLIRDWSLRQAIDSCHKNCGWEGDLRVWLNSLPLERHDLITAWSRGDQINSPKERQVMIDILGRLDSKGLWRYSGTIHAEYISIMHQSKGFYVGLKDVEDFAQYGKI